MKVIDHRTFSFHIKNRCAKFRKHLHSPRDVSNSNTVHKIPVQPFSLETWHCHEQPLISSRSFTSDTSQSPVTLGKNCPHPHVLLFPPAPLFQLQNNLKLGRFRTKQAVSLLSLWQEHIFPKHWRCPVIYMI